MPKVEIKTNQIRVGAKKISLISGEVHYWRLNPNYWKEILDRVKEMGLKVIATYIAWDYHEYARGKFDFTGKTDQTRNLKAFLELARKEGLYVIIRPGPYIYSEWPNEGAPAYAHKYHRLHPKFLAYAKIYMTEVCKILRPFLASRKGGHIILFQADNEIDPWPDTFGHQYGLNGKPGLFQKFIQGLYDDNLIALNDAWGTEYRSFEQVGAFTATMLKDETGLSLKGDKELKRHTDYFKFKYWYSKEYAQWVIQTYRSLKIDIPIYLNLYPFFYAHDWHEMQSISDMVGVDFYPTAEFSEDAFEQRKFIDKIRYAKAVTKVPYIAEFAAGVWHARHYETGVLTPNHYRLLAFSAILGGIAGWNWYMLVNRDNWYMSPINEWGRVRGELYDVFKQVVTVYNRVQPASLTKLTEVAVTYNPLQHAARTLSHNNSILKTLYESDVDYTLYDPRFKACSNKILFYSGNQWLEEESQKHLRSYVEQGGILVAFRNYPRKNDRFETCSLVGFEEPKSTLFEFKRKMALQILPGRPKVDVLSSIYTFSSPKGDKITADCGPFGRLTVGYVKKIGKGKIVHLGVEPSRELILEILNAFKVPLITYATTRDIKTGLFKRGNKYYLIVLNNGAEDKSASIYLPVLNHLKGKFRITDVVSGKHDIYSYQQRLPLSVEVPRKDGRVLELALR